jgi:guanylate kinase
MSLEEITEYIESNPPKLIYLSGKTCTGKSTFSNAIANKINYKIIELDKVVVDSVIKPLNLTDEGKVFFEVYGNRCKKEWIRRFVDNTISRINRSIREGKSVIIEGAVANVITLKDIFEDYSDFSFIYFHPISIKNYTRNITTRFLLANENNNAGLPVAFWELVDQEKFKLFCKTRKINKSLADSIELYAKNSQTESLKRLNNFRKYFPNIIEVNF